MNTGPLQVIASSPVGSTEVLYISVSNPWRICLYFPVCWSAPVDGKVFGVIMSFIS